MFFFLLVWRLWGWIRLFCWSRGIGCWGRCLWFLGWVSLWVGLRVIFCCMRCLIRMGSWIMLLCWLCMRVWWRLRVWLLDLGVRSMGVWVVWGLWLVLRMRWWGFWKLLRSSLSRFGGWMCEVMKRRRRRLLVLLLCRVGLFECFKFGLNVIGKKYIKWIIRDYLVLCICMFVCFFFV